MTNLPWLSILVFLPLLGGLCLVPLWKSVGLAKVVALAVGLAELALCAMLLQLPKPMSATVPGFALLRLEDLPWIERLGIRYTMGLDGISLVMVLLTSFITVIAILVSWRGIKEKIALHYATILIMETGIMGVFLSLDLVLFYLFWEVMLVPMFLLIGIWGHGRRVYSAVKFFLYTLAGSLLMLLAIIALYLIHGGQSGSYTFALPQLLQTRLDPAIAGWLFAAFLLAFAIKVPLFPLHTWLPDAHTDAPTAGSVILAGLLLKTGAYGLIRFGVPLFPQAAKASATLLFILAIIGIVYGSWIAFAQSDMKRLVAYSSVGHMGFVGLGIAAWTPLALSGAILQMVNHGVTTGALFALVGMLDERTDTREIAAYGGLWGRVPMLSFFFLFFAMASAGLPGLNNFAGEFIILTGSFPVAPWAVAIGFFGVVLGLVYMVRLLQEVLFQEPRGTVPLHDLSLREGTLLAVLALTAVYLGVHPAPVLDLVKAPVQLLVGGVLP